MRRYTNLRLPLPLGCQHKGDSHKDDGRLLLLSARPADTFPATEHHHPSLPSIKLYCLATEANVCEQPA